MASCAGEMTSLITLTSFQSVVRIYPGNWDGCKRKQKSHRQAHMQSHVLLALNDGDGKTNTSERIVKPNCKQHSMEPFPGRMFISDSDSWLSLQAL